MQPYSMKAKILKVHPADNVVVALTDLPKGETVSLGTLSWCTVEPIPAKHKFAAHALEPGDQIIMYGVIVGTAQRYIPEGSWINTQNVVHAAGAFSINENRKSWQAPDVSKWADRTFLGYHRSDGSVGTANYWLVIPLVFCENRNIEVLREALVHDLGYDRKNSRRLQTQQLISMYQAGNTVAEILSADLDATAGKTLPRLFPNVDGVKFLSHDGGCGGTRQDAQALCGLLAGYITHPNVAGATVLSLGCQHAQIPILQEAIAHRNPDFDKPLFILEQQQIGVESDLIAVALKQTFTGLMEANRLERQPAPLSKLCIGLECGGSDGFSGISANPILGQVSDLVVALGGTVILSEFPELCGVEQELADRCADKHIAQKFADLMTTYNDRAKAAGSGFDMNPSPGNIRDGLITDAMKSAGAAKKGGTSPIVDVLDYPEKVNKPGLNLLCTPGNDVESTTAEVGSGANIVLFTTGLGTPTGNPVAPVVKVATNTKLARRMHDIIDFDAGGIISGEESIEQAADRLLEYIIHIASGETEVAATRFGQDDFIPWKRGVSL